MNAEGEFPIPELRVVNQLRHQLTYAGCEDDVRLAESYWTAGYPGNIQEEVNSMRRKQQLYEGDRSDVVLQVLDDVKRQLTYPDWKHDVSFAEDSWVAGSRAGVRKDIEEMRRRQQLQKGDRSDVVLQVLDDVKRQLTYPDWKHDVSFAEDSWVAGSRAGVRKDIEEMRRRQQLHDLKRKRSATTLANQPKHTNVAWVVYLVMALPILSC